MHARRGISLGLMGALGWSSGCTWGGGSVGDGDYRMVCQGVGPRTISGDLDLTFAEAGEVEALSCVREVEGDLLLFNNATLDSLAGLERLRAVGGDVTIVGAPALKDLGGLSGLESAGSLTIQSAPLVTDLTGLERLAATDAVAVAYNDGLISLDGLQNLSAGLSSEAVSVAIGYNSQLIDIVSLGAISVLGDVLVEGNAAVESVDGLGATHVDGGLHLIDNHELRDLSALSDLSAVGPGGLVITGNSSLVWLEGLEQLRAVHGDLVVGDNLVLTTLDGLSGLGAVDGAIEIFDNPCVPQSEVEDLVNGLKADEDHGDGYRSGNDGPCGGV